MYIPSFNPLFSDRFPRYRCHYLLSSPLPVYLFPFFSFPFFSFISLSLSLLSVLPCSLSERIEGSTTTTTTRTRLCKPSHSPTAIYTYIQLLFPDVRGRQWSGTRLPWLPPRPHSTFAPSTHSWSFFPRVWPDTILALEGKEKKGKGKKTSVPWKVNETAVAWTNSLNKIDNELFRMDRLETRYYLYSSLSFFFIHNPFSIFPGQFLTSKNHP